VKFGQLSKVSLVFHVGDSMFGFGSLAAITLRFAVSMILTEATNLRNPLFNILIDARTRVKRDCGDVRGIQGPMSRSAIFIAVL
jgi:hypothetical protein